MEPKVSLSASRRKVKHRREMSMEIEGEKSNTILSAEEENLPNFDGRSARTTLNPKNNRKQKAKNLAM